MGWCIDGAGKEKGRGTKGLGYTADGLVYRCLDGAGKENGTDTKGLMHIDGWLAKGQNIEG